ncbi:MAG: hypothetical protein RLZZ618_2642 [Pseudomonadota bacterium]
MHSSAVHDVMPLRDRQLLTQLGGRLKRAREARGLSAAELARQVGISRTTLQAVERGLPSPSMGTYMAVLSVLGFAADMTLLATGESDTMEPVAPAEFSHHAAQDYQSLLMHVAAVRMLKLDARLVGRATTTLARWRETSDPRSQPLFDEWARILRERAWHLAVAPDERGNQLRQASPLSTLLPEEERLAIIRRVKALKQAGHEARSA